MPPHPDELLQERILKAAQKLWRTRGQHGLTLRAVAKEAGTTTPTVYKRFRNKEELLKTLAERLREQLNELLFNCKSLEEVAQCYLNFAEEHPHEYQLLWHTWTSIFHPDLPRPARAWILTEAAKRFGGKPEEYVYAFSALLFLVHGAADLLSVPGDEIARQEVREHFRVISPKLIEELPKFRKRARGRRRADSAP